MVERQLPKLNVAGSIPVSRSKKITNLRRTATERKSNLKSRYGDQPRHLFVSRAESLRARLAERWPYFGGHADVGMPHQRLLHFERLLQVRQERPIHVSEGVPAETLNGGALSGRFR